MIAKKQRGVTEFLELCRHRCCRRHHHHNPLLLIKAFQKNRIDRKIIINGISWKIRVCCVRDSVFARISVQIKTKP